MDLWQITQIVLRRWYVFIPVCVVTALALTRVSHRVQPEFHSTAVVQVNGPTTSPHFATNADVPVNPWLQQGTANTAQALMILMMGQADRYAILEAGGSPSYAITVRARSSLMTFDIAADTAARAKVTSAQIPVLVAKELARVQDESSARDNQRLTVEALVSGETPALSQPGLRKEQAAVLGLGLALAVVSSLALDAGLSARRRRAARSAHHAGVPQGIAPGLGPDAQAVRAGADRDRAEQVAIDGGDGIDDAVVATRDPEDLAVG